MVSASADVKPVAVRVRVGFVAGEYTLVPVVRRHCRRALCCWKLPATLRAGVVLSAAPVAVRPSSSAYAANSLTWRGAVSDNVDGKESAVVKPCRVAVNAGSLAPYAVVRSGRHVADALVIG